MNDTSATPLDGEQQPEKGKQTEHLEDAEVFIKSECDYRGSVDLLTNGWVHLPERNEMYPPHKIEGINITEEVEKIPLSKDKIKYPFVAIGGLLTLLPIGLFAKYNDAVLTQSVSITGFGFFAALVTTFIIGTIITDYGLDPNTQQNLNEAIENIIGKHPPEINNEN